MLAEQATVRSVPVNRDLTTGPRRSTVEARLYADQPASCVRLPKISIAKSDGDVKKRPLFVADFVSSVGNTDCSNAQKMAYLRSLLSDQVQNSISQFMLDPELYPQVMKELERQYSHHYVIALAHIKPMLDLPSIKDNSLDLLDFANRLNGSVGVLSGREYKHEFLSSGLLAQISAKIPLRLQQEWSAVIFNMQPKPPSIAYFSEWLNCKSRSEQFRNPFSQTSTTQTTLRQEKYQQRNLPNRRNGPNVFVTSEASIDSNVLDCLACSGSHELASCKIFDKMTAEKRIEMVFERRLCLRCLKQGHRSRECRSQLFRHI